MNENSEIKRVGTISVLIPLIAFVISLVIPNILALDYVHVLLAAIWTGTDVFLGFIFFIVISGMDEEIRYRIAVRLLPMTMFFIPAVSLIVPTAGYALAVREGIFTLDALFISILAISGILIILSYVFILGNSLFIYRCHEKSSFGHVDMTVSA
ncbi:hypothetical protein ACNF42_06710 [Cuniculiplasma sp. SKW3]|uniref:hypothetical protein n=1 Tax=Cuniculiplasma sp. SKW3 TaxID=3400170 RepID=UPI003FD4B5FD